MSTARALTNQLTNDDRLRRQIFRTLIIALSALSLCYVYFIGSITFSILARRSLAANEQAIGSKVAELELQYVALSSTINASYGTSHGFVAPQTTLFASRDSARVAMR